MPKTKVIRHNGPLEAASDMHKEKKLRVVFITPGGTASRGGMGSMAHYLTQAYEKSYPELSVRVLDSYGSGRRLAMPFHFLKCLLWLGVLCLVHRPDLVHLNLAAHGSTLRKLLLMRLARARHVPTLLHLHASKFIPFCESLKPRSREMLCASLSLAGRIVVIGEFWQRYLVDTLGIPSDKVVVIHNAVPLPPRPPPRAQGTRCRILALGLLGPRKGTPDLLDALATPQMRALDWDAVIAGNGTVDATRERVITLGLAQRVNIPGWVDMKAVAGLLAAADIFVLPSYNEGLPVAVLEAMGAGIPVITTPVGAIPELVVPDETGLLVPPGAPQELAMALTALVADPEFRHRLGDNARERVERHFRVEVMAERVVALYRELTANPSGSAASMTDSLSR